MRWETAATGAEAEALQERIWDLHDKLSHAILSLSACAGLPACGCRAPNGHVVVKGRRPQGGGHGDLAAASAAMSDTRGLHAIRAALEDLEGHLHFLHDVQLQQRAERDAAIARVQQSRILLAAMLAEHRGKGHGVIEEALGFVGDVLDKSQFVLPEAEDVYRLQNQSGEDENRRGHGSNMVVRVVSCTFALAKNILRFEGMGGVLGNATVLAVSMLAFLQLNQLTLGKQTPAVQFRRTHNRFHSGGSRKNSEEKLEVLLARG